MDVDEEHGMNEQLTQLANETAIFERVIYKNTNQHRRCLYFRRLRQVKRDLCLLQSARLNVHVQHSLRLLRTLPNREKKGEDLAQMTHLRKCLLGTARLLEQAHHNKDTNFPYNAWHSHLVRFILNVPNRTSAKNKQDLQCTFLVQYDPVSPVRYIMYPTRCFLYLSGCIGSDLCTDKMSEPILDASSQIAGLLRQTFFMPFALIVLSCLARLRVLSQQVLCDVTLIYNKLSLWGKDLLAEQHASQISQCGCRNEDLPMSLECEWKEVKFILIQTHAKKSIESSGVKNGVESIENDGTSAACGEESLQQENSLVLCENLSNAEKNNSMNTYFFHSQMQRGEKDQVDFLDNRIDLNENGLISKVTEVGIKDDSSMVQSYPQEAAPEVKVFPNKSDDDSKNFTFEPKLNKKVAYISVDIKPAKGRTTDIRNTEASELHGISADSKDKSGVEMNDSRSKAEFLFDMLLGMGGQQTDTLF